MKDPLQKIESLFTDLKTHKISKESHGVRPARDWQIILVATFILALVVSAVAFYFFFEVQQGNLFVVAKTDAEQPVKIDTVLLKKTVDDINARADTLSKIKQENAAPAEPSS